MTLPLVQLDESQPYMPGAGEYVITEKHSMEDILMHIIEQDCPGMTRSDACDHLIALLEIIAKTVWLED